MSRPPASSYRLRCNCCGTVYEDDEYRLTCCDDGLLIGEYGGEFSPYRSAEGLWRFLDWLLTPTAAKLYGERAELSTVPGVKAPEAMLATGLPSDPTTLLYKMDFDLSAKNRYLVLSLCKKDIER